MNIVNILFGKFSDWSIFITNNLRSSNYKIKICSLLTANINNLDLVIPCSIEEISYFARNLSSNSSNIICCKDINTVNLLNNKLEFILWMKQNNLSSNIPELYYSQVDNSKFYYKEEFTYPCISKSIIGLASENSYFIYSEKDINYNNSSNFIIQKYIEHPEEYAGHFYVKNGVIIYSKIFKTTNRTISRIYMVKGAIRDYACVIIDSKHTELFKNIFEKLDYNGFACIDFRIKDDIVYIFEINPRLGGSIVRNSLFFKEMIDVVVENYKNSK